MRRVTFRKQLGAGSQDSGIVFPKGSQKPEDNEEGVSHGDPSLRVLSLVLGPGCLEKRGEITYPEARPEAMPVMWRRC